MPVPNVLLRAIRERTPSRVLPGTSMSREELADHVTQWLAEHDHRPAAFDANHVGKLERGIVRRPSAHYRAALRAVLNASDTDLGFESAPITDDDTDRLLVITKTPRRVDTASLDALGAVLQTTRQLEDRTSSATVLPATIHLTQLAEQFAAEARLTTRAHACELASEMNQYLGWLYLSTEHYQTAEECLTRAIALAVEADSPERLAHGLSFKGYGAHLTGQPTTAAHLSALARRDSRVFPGLRTYDTFQEAQALADAQDYKAADRALLAADRLMEAAAEDTPPPSGYWYTEAFLLTQRGLTLQALGRHDEARRDIIDGLADMPEAERNAEWTAELRAAAEVVPRSQQ